MLDKDQLNPDAEPGVDNSVDVSTVDSEGPASAVEPQADDEIELLRAELDRSRSESTARLQSLENLLVQVVNQRQSVPVNEPEIDLDDPLASYKLMERKLTHELKKRDEQRERELSAIREREFQNTVRAVNAENQDVVKRFGRDIEEYYRNNPQERQNPNSYPVLIKYLKGELYDEERAKRRVSSPPAPNTPSPRVSPPPAEKPTFSPEEERIAKIYGMLEGKEITPEDWHNVKNDRLKYPGRRGGR